MTSVIRLHFARRWADRYLSDRDKVLTAQCEKQARKIYELTNERNGYQQMLAAEKRVSVGRQVELDECRATFAKVNETLEPLVAEVAELRGIAQSITSGRA